MTGMGDALRIQDCLSRYTVGTERLQQTAKENDR